MGGAKGVQIQISRREIERPHGRWLDLVRFAVSWHKECSGALSHIASENDFGGIVTEFPAASEH
jgi:hypothetical protein